MGYSQAQGGGNIYWNTERKRESALFPMQIVKFEAEEQKEKSEKNNRGNWLRSEDEDRKKKNKKKRSEVERGK